MVTEYIKRNQKWGYDENGNFLYKVPMEAESPVVEETAPTEEAPVENLFDPLLGDE
jgi:hypothetical protein